MVLIMTAGHTSAKPLGNLEEQDSLLTGPRGHTRHGMPKDYVARLWGEREGEGMDLGLCPLLGFEAGVPRVSWIHFLLVNLKLKGGN